MNQCHSHCHRKQTDYEKRHRIIPTPLSVDEVGQQEESIADTAQIAALHRVLQHPSAKAKQQD